MPARLLISGVGGVFLTSAFNTTISIYLQAWTTKLVNVPTSAYIAFLGGYAGMQIGFLCIFTGAIFYAFVYSHPISSYRLHEWQIRGFLQTSLRFAESHTAGQLMNRFNSDLNTIDFELPNAAVNFFYGATTAGFGFILMAVAGPYMIAVIVVTLGVMIVVQRFYVRAARELRRLDLTAKSPIYDLFGETMDSNGLCTIRAMQTEEACREFNSTRATASQHPAWLLFAVQKWLELALNLCVMIINTALVLIAVVTRRSISIGILAVAMSQAANLSLALQMIIMEWTSMSSVFAGRAHSQRWKWRSHPWRGCRSLSNFPLKTPLYPPTRHGLTVDLYGSIVFPQDIGQTFRLPSWMFRLLSRRGKKLASVVDRARAKARCSVSSGD